MSRTFSISLPVKDLQRSVAFFTALGFTFNPLFTDENATCMVIGEGTFVMLLSEKFFATFTDKAIVDAHTHVESVACIGLQSDEDVNRIADAALQVGGQEERPAQDYGFMYQRSFQDLDGHAWELIHMRSMPG